LRYYCVIFRLRYLEDTGNKMTADKLSLSINLLLVIHGLFGHASAQGDTPIFPQDTEGAIGEQARFECRLSSSGIETVWMFYPKEKNAGPYAIAVNCIVLAASKNQYHIENINNAYNLIIDKVTASHYGTYTCQDFTAADYGHSAELVKPEEFVDCAAIKEKRPNSKSGVYKLKIPGSDSSKVYCDMDTDGGGWTVIQRRTDGSVNFFRGWTDYAAGFGKPDTEYWLGNNLLASLTSARNYRLRVDIGDFNNGKAYAEYAGFKVSDLNDKYRLTIGGYSGNAGNSLYQHGNRQFSTRDQDNDPRPEDCAVENHGAWWYGASGQCSTSNLNGEYLKADNHEIGKGVFWDGQFLFSLKFTEMKIRPQ
jgi:hypothetical protein